MKKKIKKSLYQYIKHDGFTAVIALIVILVGLLWIHCTGKQIDIIDWTIFSTIVATLLLEVVAHWIKTILLNKLEDSVKLTDDYEKLSKKYLDDMLTYDNSMASPENLTKLNKMHEMKEVVIPVICEYKMRGNKVTINDSHKMFKLPELIEQHFDEIFAAHSTSTVYNQLNIRVDDWKCKDGEFIMDTSRTSYYNSLVTNRAMDFQWENGMTVREQFEFEPYLHTLKESPLSNHLGFNGFVESSDGYIVFVKRDKNLSIAKGTYANSIGASLKAKYALDSSGNFTVNGLKNGILKEIQDELKIPEDGLNHFSLRENLIAAYRDLVEGGKPQLLFYAQSLWTKNEIEKNFYQKTGNDEMRSEQMVEDGNKFLWIHRLDILKLCVLPGAIIHKGKSYPMVPSATASVVMLIEYIRENY